MELHVAICICEFGIRLLASSILPGGWTGQTWNALPAPERFQYSAAGLFTWRTKAWWDQHLEGRGTGNQRFEIAEPSVFPMGAFGFRSRCDRILIKTNRSPNSERVKRRPAEHVMRKLAGGASAKDAEDHGHASDVFAPPLKMVQLVRTVWPVGEERIANPAGRAAANLAI